MGVFSHWPNRITAIRFAGAAVLFTILAVKGDRSLEEVREARGFVLVTVWLFIVTAATDFLDGYLARRDKHVTAFGRIADPFTDKVLILGAMVFLAVMPWTRDRLPAWMVVTILAREFLVTGIRGYVESVGGEFPADTFGKVKMIVQCVAVASLFWLEAYAWPDGWYQFWSWVSIISIWITLIATVGSGLSYVLKTRKVLEQAGRP
jgi:CDP-diacylglycerol--glycerol-3-phosphate 3-phosphatidyltransferase